MGAAMVSMIGGDTMASMSDVIRRAAGRPAPTEAERRHEQQRADAWAALTPAEKFQQAIDKAARKQAGDAAGQEGKQ